MTRQHGPDQPGRDANLPDHQVPPSLTAALRQEASLPLGLRARVEAKVLAALRQPSGPGLSPVMAGCGLFVILGARPEVVVLGPLAILLFVVVAGYARFVLALGAEGEGSES